MRFWIFLQNLSCQLEWSPHLIMQPWLQAPCSAMLGVACITLPWALNYALNAQCQAHTNAHGVGLLVLVSHGP